MSIRTLPPPGNPVLLQHAQERAKSAENRIADTITQFAGSMPFVYVHAIWFTVWIALGVERYPYGLLTMIVSLEAIFLSTFVMISQNRADEKRQILADNEWRKIQAEEVQNQQLLGLANQILALTQAISAWTPAQKAAGPTGAGTSARDPGSSHAEPPIAAADSGEQRPS